MIRYTVKKHVRLKSNNHSDFVEMQKPQTVVADLLSTAVKHCYRVDVTYKDGDLYKAIIRYDNDTHEVYYFIERIKEEN